MPTVDEIKGILSVPGLIHIQDAGVSGVITNAPTHRQVGIASTPAMIPYTVRNREVQGIEFDDNGDAIVTLKPEV